MKGAVLPAVCKSEDKGTKERPAESDLIKVSS
jgi:hypothetical protein